MTEDLEAGLIERSFRCCVMDEKEGVTEALVWSWKLKEFLVLKIPLVASFT